MKKFIKIISSILAVFLLIAIIAPFILAKVFDPNDYKGEISKLVEDKTGRQLTISGDLSYSIFPWLGLSIGEMQLSNSTAPGFSKTAFAKITSAEVRVKIVPLLSAEIEVDKVVLDGLSLSLQKNKQGIPNWQDLIAKQQANNANQATNNNTNTASPNEATNKTSTEVTSEPPSKEDTTETTPSSGNSSTEQNLAMLFPAIAGVEIKNANIQWHDQQLNQKFDLNDFNFKTGIIADQTATTLDIDYRFKINEPAVSGKSQISTKLKFNINKQSILIRDLEFTQELDQKLLKPENIEIQLKISQIKADLKKQTASITKLNLSVLAIELDGSFKAKNILSDVSVSGNLSSNEFSPKDIIKTLEIALPKMADNKAFNKAKLNLKISATTKQVSLSKIIVTLDETILTGNLKLANFAKPKIRYQFTMNEIDVDRYLPPVDKDAAKKKAELKKSEAKKAIAKKSTKTNPNKQKSNNKKGSGKTQSIAESEEIPIPIPSELLRTLNIKGSFALNKLKVSNLKLNKLKFDVNAKDGVIQAKPVSAKLYKGSFDASVNLNVTKNVPVVSLQQKINGIAFKPMVVDLFEEEYLSGTGNVSVNITTKGLTVSQFTKNLNGNVTFNINDSKIKFLSLKYLIDKAVSDYQKKEFKKDKNFDNPDVFKVMKGSFQIVNGVANNKDFITESRDLNLTGKGSVDLVKQYVKYEVKAYLQKPKTGNADFDAYLKNRAITNPIYGPFDNLSYNNPDVAQLLTKFIELQAKKAVDKKLDEEKKVAERKLKNKLDEEKKVAERKLKNKLGDLFK